MISQHDSYSPNWRPFPTKKDWLSEIRLVLPAANGIYGPPSDQIVIMSNHQPSLVKLGKMDQVTAWVLDGGGFPLEVAVAFGFLKPPANNFQIDFLKFSREQVLFLVPSTLAASWHWHDDEVRLGGTIRVVPDNFPANVPSVFIRLYAGVRLAIGQICLMAVPVAAISWTALIPVILMVFVGLLLLTGFWTTIPGNGWVKGIIAGSVCVAIIGFLGAFRIFSFHPIVYLAILMTFTWLGGALTGARNTV